MSELQNKNNHYTNKWQLGLHRTPALQYMCREVEFPSIGLQPIPMPTPVGKFYVGGKIIDYGQFSFTFQVDENFENYYSIFEWMTGLAGSVDMIKYKELTTDFKHNVIGTAGHNIYSDGTLFSLTNASNINQEFNIINMFPTALGSPRFSLDDPTVNVCTATFQCDYFEINRKST